MNHRIMNSNDLSEYNSHFVTITHYLIDLGKISDQEQSRAFFRGMHTQLRDKVLLRLQQKYVNHDQDTPYPINQIYKATDFVLAGGSTAVSMNWQQPTIPTTGMTTTALATTMTIASSTDPTAVKIEALTSVISSLGEMFKTVIQNQTQQPGTSSRSVGLPPAGPSGPGNGGSGGGGPLGNSACNFCRLSGHYIRECEVTAEYIRTGKCKRNHEGRVVLPAGEMVPQHITGTWLCGRIDEYHRQNPGQIRAATMLFEIAQHDTLPPTYATGQPFYHVRHVNQYSTKDTTDAFAMH